MDSLPDRNRIGSSLRHPMRAWLPLVCLLISGLACGLLTGTVTATPYGGGNYGNCSYGSGCSISLTTSGTLSIPLTPTSGSIYSIQKDPVVVVTNNPLGYSLTLESNSATTAALVNGGSTLEASGGTPNAPQTLSVNTWGYRLDGQASFGAGPTNAATNTSSSSLSFAGPPLNGFPQTIYSQATASAAGGDTVDVWYGVRASTSIPAGTYTQTIIYTAIATP